MSILELKQEYNKLVDRKERALAFYNNLSTEECKKEALLPEFNKIIKQLSLLRVEYKKVTGEEMTEAEATNGFHLIKGL